MSFKVTTKGKIDVLKFLGGKNIKVLDNDIIEATAILDALKISVLKIRESKVTLQVSYECNDRTIGELTPVELYEGNSLCLKRTDGFKVVIKITAQ